MRRAPSRLTTRNGSDTNVCASTTATEVKATYSGRMTAVEPQEWSGQGEESAEQLSEVLLELAKQVKLSTLRKHPRAAKKKVKKGYVSAEEARKHVATARVLKGEKP